jgi:hypothetical protein
VNKPELIRVQHLDKVTTFLGKKTLSVDYMGNRYLYDKWRNVVYWTQLQPAIAGWGFMIKEN